MALFYVFYGDRAHTFRPQLTATLRGANLSEVAADL